MNTQHTPGPWGIQTHLRYAINSPTRHVAMVSCMEKKEGDRGENEANARLIHLAPDLLKALEELLEVQDEPCRIDHQGYCQSHYLDNVNIHGGCRVANARALVAKVKGGAA